jgi:ClpP class serine protease
MSHIDNLNKNQLEGHKWSIETLLDQAKQEVARYENELKAIADRFKVLATESVETVQEKVEEVVETVKEEVKKAAPKKVVAKKTATKVDDAKVDESDAK